MTGRMLEVRLMKIRKVHILSGGDKNHTSLDSYLGKNGERHTHEEQGRKGAKLPPTLPHL
jgi:hypothetical protein